MARTQEVELAVSGVHAAALQPGLQGETLSQGKKNKKQQQQKRRKEGREGGVTSLEGAGH